MKQLKKYEKELIRCIDSVDAIMNELIPIINEYTYKINISKSKEEVRILKYELNSLLYIIRPVAALSKQFNNNHVSELFWNFWNERKI